MNVLNIVESVGFTHYRQGVLADIVFSPDLRKMCEMNTCGKYGTTYMCPPNCGDVDDCINRVRQFPNMMLVQTVYQLEDSWDFEGMGDAMKVHNDKMSSLIALMASYTSSKYMILGAGGCTICETCKCKTNEPCIAPDRAISSVEAYGMEVNKTLVKLGLKYNNGEATVSYVGVVMYQ